jgi:hypothetical protein
MTLTNKNIEICITDREARPPVGARLRGCVKIIFCFKNQKIDVRLLPQGYLRLNWPEQFL